MEQRTAIAAHLLQCSTAGGQKCVVIMSVAQAVECYVAYFHANNCKYSNKLLPQISQYFVQHFCWLLYSKYVVEKTRIAAKNRSNAVHVSISICTQSDHHEIERSKYLILCATLDNFPKCFRYCWHPATVLARDTWNILSIFPLTSLQRMVHGSVIILKEPRLTTKCLDTTGINCRLKCQYISENQYSYELVW